MLAELGELAHDDGARVDPDEDGEQDERVDEEVQDRAAVARDVAERGRSDDVRAIAQQREQVDGDEGCTKLYGGTWFSRFEMSSTM